MGTRSICCTGKGGIPRRKRLYGCERSVEDSLCLSRSLVERSGSRRLGSCLIFSYRRNALSEPARMGCVPHAVEGGQASHLSSPDSFARGTHDPGIYPADETRTCQSGLLPSEVWC